MFAAIEDVDAILAVHADAAHVLEIPARRELRPVLDHAIAMLAASQDHRHAVLLYQTSVIARSASDVAIP
jgi:hypothetical protein